MRFDWDNFNAIHGKNANDEFEVLSGMVVEKIEVGRITNTPTNYKGIESELFVNSSGKKVAYQSKFSTTGTDASLVSGFMESLRKLNKNEVDKIDILYITSNKLGSGSQRTLKTKLTTQFTKIKAKQPNIKFVCGITRFKSDLLTLSEFDGARSYFFGGGNPRALHEANISSATMKVLESGGYIELPMKDTAKSFESDRLLSETTDPKRTSVLMVAGAGTGKSLLLQKLAFDFSSLGKSHPEIMQTILKNGVVVLLRASLYKGQSLNSVIANKLSNYGMSLTDYPITLILDGLDELSFDDSTNMINELQDLYSSKIIKRCIASVRNASSSATRYQQVMSPHQITILPLTETKMVEYFKKRGDKTKTKLLKEVVKDKKDTSDITDIRILELYWVNIEKGILPGKSQILNAAFSAHVGDRTLDLNLLNPKKGSLKIILESLSVETLLHGGRTVELAFMQQKILDTYERMNYRDVNDVIERIANVCGEHSDFDEGEDFTFEHKSWIDYFSALYLARKFKESKSSLLELIDYEDILANWFVPVARYEYRKGNLLPEAIGVGIIEAYLGFESDRTDDIEEQVIKVQLSTGDDALRESVILHAEELIATNSATNPRIIYEYLKAGHRSIAEQLNKVFCDKLDEGNNEFANRAYWDYFNYFYLIQLEFSTRTPIKFLERFNEIISQYTNKRSWDFQRKIEPTIAKVYSNLMSRGITVDQIFKSLNADILPLSLTFIYEPETIRALRSSTPAQESLKALIDGSELKDIDRFSLMALLNIEFGENEEAAKAAHSELNDSLSSHLNNASKYLTRLYLLRRAFGWSQTLKQDPEDYHYLMLQDVFDVLFHFATEKDFISDFAALEVKLKEVVDNATTYSLNRDNFSRKGITSLMAYIAENLSVQNTRKLIKLNEENSSKFIYYSLLLEGIFSKDRGLFNKLFKLDEVEKTLDAKKGDLESYTDELRSKAVLIAYIDPSRAPDLLNELRRLTRLRYGYHKDILGFFLPTALKTAIEKDYFSNKQKMEYIEKIYTVILDIQDITDHDEVGWLPDEFFAILIDYDFDLALKYHNKYLLRGDYDMPILDQINIAHVKRGDAFNDIKRHVNSYRREHRTQDEIFETYYESRFAVFVNVADSEHYSQDERIEAIRAASNELAQLKRQDKDYRESDYERGKFLRPAIARYRKLVKLLLPDEKLETIRRPKRYKNQASDLVNKLPKNSITDYERKENKAKAQFAMLPSDQAYKKIIKDISANKYSRYNSLIINSKQNTDLFISELEKHKEPLTNFSHLIASYLDYYSYRGESQYFIDKIWSSPLYKHQFIEWLFNKPHHHDTNLLLKVWADNNEKELVIGLIKQITDCIALLARKD
jgi:hypothetical protein